MSRAFFFFPSHTIQKMRWHVPALAALQVVPAVSAASISPSTFTVPGAFPTSVFTKYYNNPTATSVQVQPVVSDPVTHETYPLSLTDPDKIPLQNIVDPHPLPPKASSSKLYDQALAQILGLATNTNFGTNECARCHAILEILKFISLAAPEQAPKLVVALCDFLKLSKTCSATHGAQGLGSVITQVLANANVAGYDGQAFCQNFLGMCPAPPTSPLNLAAWFQKPKPNPLPPPKKPSGKRLKVLHISDFHLDPRYATGAEANCTSGGPCCRKNNFNLGSPNATLLPAPRFGSFRCDTPLSLGLSALQAIPALAGTRDTGFAWTLYTGDLVSHDPDNQLSRGFVQYVETIAYDLFRRMLGSGPVYAALGNHDSYNQAQDAPHSLGGALANQFSWNYDHVAGLWKHEKWLPDAAVKLAKAHYSAYMVKRMDGLRIISLNTDFWYRANYFNYINMTNPDTSGMLRFLTDELQSAEDAGDRVWIMGHVLTGWDGTNPLLNPTNLFYQIVDRFSPHVIANIFFGHTHEDQMSIFYANNGTVMNAETAHTLAWLAPSITPITNLNSGFRVYEVDSATFEIMDAHTWKSDVSAYPDLDGQTALGPVYTYEYNTRETYGKNIPNWTENDPLNATWWHRVTEAMEADSSLVSTFNTLQGKGSVMTRACTGDCISAKICYIRSGSASIAMKNCQQGFGSVQS
ncbi:Sphingomyelin phosphodiesterase [Hypsizygus marmoreus]|uniref:Sphingomyelin phosphodiesterase n=1 Tax=Hypsizygus marmoreus TaxID=39966 RepID=A0A369K7T9_HYPMA|nr:Sphingomyelin phosphodiesterase [Hypsizygus marmoreus]